MADTVRESCNPRGGLGVLILLYSDAQRFTDLADVLHISGSTLTPARRARNLGPVTPEIDERETSIGDRYRLSERGALIVKKLERFGVVHAYRTMLDMHQQAEDGRSDLDERLDGEKAKKKLARCSEEDPYVDPFGQDVTGYSE